MANKLQTTENKYHRRILKVPQGTASYSVNEELGMKYILDLVAVKPLLYWVKIWTSQEAGFNQLVIEDYLSLDHGLKIPWLRYVKDTLMALGKADIFVD